MHDVERDFALSYINGTKDHPVQLFAVDLGKTKQDTFSTRQNYFMESTVTRSSNGR